MLKIIKIILAVIILTVTALDAVILRGLIFIYLILGVLDIKSSISNIKNGKVILPSLSILLTLTLAVVMITRLK